MMNEKFKKVIMASVATALFVVPTTSAIASASTPAAAAKPAAYAAAAISTSKNVNSEIKLKTIAAMVRAGGWLLENALKPFSKKAADNVLKYRSQIADALEALETWSKSQFVNLLVKAGVPKDVADSIAEVIVFLVL
ncbi:hypothetical protein YSY43_41230 [Paenibacillus sp. YSY-4.3]